MPTSPTIEHFISLGDRLDAAASRVQVPGEPTRSVSANLAHVPARMHVVYGTTASDEHAMEMTFTYLDEVTEPRLPGFVQESKEGKYAVDMEVGAHTGRVYRLAMKVLDLSDESLQIITEGIRACFDDYFRVHQAPLRQQAILRSTWALVTSLLPGLVKRIRSNLEPRGKPTQRR